MQFVLSDTGPGIPKKNLNKIFEPFFTTKGVGKGTGIGLSLSYGVVQSHGGTIRVESEDGQGAAFVIELPMDRQGKVQPAKSEKKNEISMRENDHPRLILLVEDQQSIAGFMQAILAPRGHEIDMVTDGESALTRVKEKDFDIIICDYHLPKMDGRSLYEKVRQYKEREAKKFFFITGSSLDESMSHFFSENKLRCLMKPFTAEDLLSLIDSKLKV